MTLGALAERLWVLRRAAVVGDAGDMLAELSELWEDMAVLMEPKAEAAE
jgi:hypothetical protein